MIEPLFDRVVVRPVPSEETTPGGLYKPQNAIDRSCEGTVFAIGPNVTAVEPGDHVFYGKFAGSDVEVDGESMVIMRVEEIFARLCAGTKARSA